MAALTPKETFDQEIATDRNESVFALRRHGLFDFPAALPLFLFRLIATSPFSRLVTDPYLILQAESAERRNVSRTSTEVES